MAQSVLVVRKATAFYHPAGQIINFTSDRPGFERSLRLKNRVFDGLKSLFDRWGWFFFSRTQEVSEALNIGAIPVHPVAEINVKNVPWFQLGGGGTDVANRGFVTVGNDGRKGFGNA